MWFGFWFGSEVLHSHHDDSRLSDDELAKAISEDSRKFLVEALSQREMMLAQELMAWTGRVGLSGGLGFVGGG